MNSLTCTKCGCELSGLPDIDYQFIGLDAICNDCYNWEDEED